MATYIVQHRRGSREAWEEKNLVPNDGEIILVRDGDETKIRIGDGDTPFNGLKDFASGYATESYVDDKLVKQVLTKTRIVTLLADAWLGDKSPWTQEVQIDGITPYSKVDLQPNAVQLAELTDEEVTLVAENTNAVITVYAINEKPTKDYTMQTTITEVIT